MRYLLVILATILVIILGALLFPYTGLYNVAATAGHTDFTRWYLHTMTERSVEARADGITVPGDLLDSARVARGALAYREMCRGCHGAPGLERSVVGQGLTPQPPRLNEEAEWEPGEVYWILDHGIKMAGMPAFGPTHDEEELWELVAFVDQLPEMTPEGYARLTAPAAAPADTTARRADDGHDHVH